MADSYYDSVVSDADGSSLRYGYFSRSTPTVTTAVAGMVRTKGRGEYDTTWHPSQSLVPVWFALDALPASGKVESAYVSFVVYAWSATSLNVTTAGTYLSVRADTSVADLHIVDAPSTVADPHNLNCSWDYVNVATTTLWSPTFAARDDWCDMGPMSSTTVEGPTTISGVTAGHGKAIRFDITDAVQQVVDRGLTTKGLLLWCVNVSGAQYDLEMGNTGARGNPELTVEMTTPYGGARPWGGKSEVPFVLATDDGDTSFIRFAKILDGEGVDLTTMISGANMAASYRMTTAQWDSLHDIYSSDFVMHGTIHEPVWSYATDAERNNALRRDWVQSWFTSNVDTTVLHDYAYPSGALSRIAYIDGIGSLVDTGYRSARTSSDHFFYWGDAGQSTYIGWDAYVNMKLLATIQSSRIFGTTAAPYTNAQVLDGINDEIDYAWRFGKKAAIITYVHDTVADTRMPDGVDFDQLVYLASVIRDQPNIRFSTYGDVVSQRLNGSPFIPPDNAFAGTAYDSMYTGQGDARFGEIWAGPK